MGFVCADLKRAIANRKFALLVIMVAVLECMDALPQLLIGAEIKGGRIILYQNVTDMIMNNGASTLYHLLSCTVGVMVFAGSYSAVKVFTCVVSAFLCIVIGKLLYVCILSLMLPLSAENNDIYQGSWQTLQQGRHWLFILYRLLLGGLQGAFFAIISFIASAFVRNKFLIYAMPSIVYYFFLYIFTDLYDLSKWNGFRILSVANVYFTFQFGLDKELESLCFTMLYTVVLAIAGWFVFDRKIRRNI